MSKKMDIYAELDDFVEENEGQVSLTDVAKHFAEHGYQYAVDKACEWLSARLLTLQKGKFEDEFRKAMEE